MRILGVSCHYHDAAACLYGDDGVIAAIEQERLTRRKHDSGFPREAIRAVLEQDRIDMSSVDHVVHYEKPLRKFKRILEMTVDGFPRAIDHFVPAMESWLREKLWVSSRYREIGYGSRIWYSEHHLSHAASAFYASPFDEAAILTADGVGESATTTIGHGSGLDLELIEEVRFPHSLGLLYSVFTAFLGFEVNEGEYKVMGLAAFGRPRYADAVRQLLRWSDQASYQLDLSYFAYPRQAAAWTSAFEDLFGRPFAPDALDEDVDERAADIAASVQDVIEDALLRLADHARVRTASRTLCMAGGVAQNVLANARIVREGVFDRVFVPPAPGDSGGAIGAAAYLAHAILRAPRPSGHSAYLGPSYEDGEIRDALNSAGLAWRSLEPSEMLRVAAGMIADGQVIGWFQGRMEFGPRALGARSILADARDPRMKDIVNARIKFREGFRPFAPAVLAEDAARYFEDAWSSPFMSFAVRVRAEARSVIPAVTHVDGTSRVQTVDESAHPTFRRLLMTLREITGHGIVLNTSFNLRGEPIVASPRDALRTFVRTSLDALFLERYLVLPPPSAGPAFVRTGREHDRGIAVA